MIKAAEKVAKRLFCIDNINTDTLINFFGKFCKRKGGRNEKE